MPVSAREYSLEERQRIDAFVERVGHRVAKSFRKYPRKSGTGPAGSRFEHWQAVGEDEVLSEQMGHLLARLAVDVLPPEVSSALLSAKLNGIRKSSGGVRVLGCGGVIRRMVFKQVARELHCTLRQWCTDKQFGIQKDGCGRMFRYIQTLFHGRKGVVLLSADQRDAYSHVNRKGAIRAGQDCCPEVEVVMRALLTKKSFHILMSDVGVKFIGQNNGFDQGCNMSSGFYCLSADAALLAGDRAAKATDPLAEVVAFIDDTYFIGLPEAVVAGHQAYQDKLWADIQVQENQDKRKCLPGEGVDMAALPEDISWCIIKSLPCVGAQLDCARADRVPATELSVASGSHVRDGRATGVGVLDVSPVRRLARRFS